MVIYKLKVLFLNGSPRQQESNSDIIVNYLINKLQERFIETSKIYLAKAVKSNDQIIDMFDSINISDSLVLIAPVYADSLPFIAVRAMELIAKYRQLMKVNIPRFYAITNCGFPEAFHNDIALANVKLFAQQCNFKLAGGIGFGMSGGVRRKSGQYDYKINKNTKMILDKIAAAISEQKDIPYDAIELTKKPAMPIWLYNFLVNNYWKKLAKMNEVNKKLDATPHQL